MNQDYLESREINKTNGKSYYFATLLLPKQKQLQTFALYSFFRIPDDIVDNSNPTSQKTDELNGFENKFWAVVNGTQKADGVFKAIKQTFAEKRFNTEWAKSFLLAMRTDITKQTYANYQEVEDYMYGSAGVVGYFMAEVIGYQNPKALEVGKTLGYAMQLTNFLRDIGPDYTELGRVYLPLDEMQKFGVTAEDIANYKFSKNFSELMQFEASRAYKMYNETLDNLDLFHPKDKFALLCALVLYRAILKKLELQDWNPFLKRASTSKFEKISLILKAWTLMKLGKTSKLKISL